MGRCNIFNLVGLVDTECWCSIKCIPVEINADGDTYIDAVDNVEEEK